MNKNITRVLSLVMALIMMLAVCATLASCADKTNDPQNQGGNEQNTQAPTNEPQPDGDGIIMPEIGEWDGVTKLDFTYKSGTTALGSNWNPHAWDTNADSSMLGYVTSPFVDMSIKTTADGGTYQWVYEMATAITDVTATHQSDLTKYGVTLPEGKAANEVTEGFVYEIKLNPNAAWENGAKITADDYIYSMQMLLNPKMKNYRANLYYSGESAVAGGSRYYYSLDEGFYKSVGSIVGSNGEKYQTNAEAIADGQTIYLDLHELWGAKGYKDADGNVIPQWVAITDETVYSSDDGSDSCSGAGVWAGYSSILEVGGDYAGMVAIYVENTDMGAGFDAVGCYKVDEYTINYVCQTYLDINYFLTSCTSTWLVYKPLYEAGLEEKEGLLVTNYGTSKETTMSYGTYRMESLQDGKQVIYVQNENWYGWEKNADGTLRRDENGNLVSITNFVIDGNRKERQYLTTKIIIDVMTVDAMKSAFLKGELSEWSPNADELSQYTMSEKLIQVDETYTMSFFFNTGLETLQALDAKGLNQNSVVLNNYNFRKAMSLAINRAEFVKATAGYKPAFSLMNSLYHYDIYNDPTSSYRNTEEAMQAIVNLYGVKYGENEQYKTLKEAHDSINGFNLTIAKQLMATACQELVAAGLYTAGQPVKIQIGWAKGALTPDDQAQVAILNKQINAALEGSGFGEVTFEAIGNIADRYAAVPAGDYAIGYGAWGGAAFYPFRNMQVYCDTVEYKGKINETGCWDPATTNLTINIGGQDVTMTWEEWSRACTKGEYATADFDTKLKITATMEEEFLKFYYRIPLCGTTIASLLTYQMEYYTTEYNIMYGFGGLRLMSFNYDDASWAAEVAAAGGELNYAG